MGEGCQGGGGRSRPGLVSCGLKGQQHGVLGAEPLCCCFYIFNILCLGREKMAKDQGFSGFIGYLGWVSLVHGMG